MPLQLNRDRLREVFYDIIKQNQFDRKYDSNIEKFMMSRKEPFQFALNIFMQANGVVFLRDKIAAKLPRITYSEIAIDSESDSDDDDYGKSVTGTIIYKRKLIKPTSIALASTITSLDIRSFSLDLIPMLKTINREMQEVNIHDSDKQLKTILEACRNIPNVQNGVTIHLCPHFDFASAMTSYSLPCRNHDSFWNWNDSGFANCFKSLSPGIKGSICFKIINDELDSIDRTKYPDVQESNNEYYKNFPVTDSLSFGVAIIPTDDFRFVR